MVIELDLTERQMILAISVIILFCLDNPIVTSNYSDIVYPLLKQLWKKSFDEDTRSLYIRDANNILKPFYEGLEK